MFAINVEQSVLGGTHYTRSLKGMLLLCEAMQRLQRCEFFKVYGCEKYQQELSFLKELKASIAKKERELKKTHLQSFIVCSDQLANDFEEFKAVGKLKRETFEYRDTFIQMVSLLKDIIRADRERNLNLHLQTAQVCFPVFVLFDCTSYLRWCSLYLEDIRKLPNAALELHGNILAGKFVLKRSSGLFRAV